MSAIDRLLEAGPTAVGDYTFVDADTLRDKDGKLLRLQGYDAPEIAGFKGGEFKGGTAGSADATLAITNLMKSGGYTNVTPTGETDPNGRAIVRLQNGEGQDFTQEIFKAGILEPGKYAQQEDIDAANTAKLFRDENFADTEWGQAAKTVGDAVAAESGENLRFKEAALSEALYNPAYNTSAVQFRSHDRDLQNNSLNPFSDAWDQGWIGAKEASFGMLNLLGETAGNQWAEEVGEAGVERARKQIGEKGRILVDYKDVDGIGSAFEYLGNNLALSLPYMAATVGGSAVTALAAPVIGGAAAIGAGLSIPASIYAGQVWNEMEGEKSASVAIGTGIAQATLDKLGLKGITGTLTGKGPKKLLNEGIEALVKQGVPREAAKQQVMQASRRELASFIGDASKVAKQQIQAKQIGKELLKKFGVAGGAESLTEGLQEATGYLGATYGSDKQFDWNELNERIVAGAIAGGALGGGLSVPGTAYDVGAWTDVAYRLQDADPSTLSESSKYAEEEKKNFGKVASIQDITAENRTAANAAPSQTTLDERAQADAHRRSQQGAFKEAGERLGNLQSLVQGATRNIFTPNLQAKSRAARKLADMFGGNLQRIFSGANYESSKHHRVTQYKSMVAIPQNFFSTMHGGKKPNGAAKIAMSDEVYGVLNTAVDKEGNFNPDLIPDTHPHKGMITKLGMDLRALGDKMHSDQAKYNPKLGYLDNYLFKYKALSKASIEKNQRGFVEALKKEFGFDEAKSKELTRQIIDNPEVNDIDDAFSVVKTSFRPQSHKSRTLALSEKKAFQDFMERDIFANVSQASRSAARYSAQQEFVGDNGKNITKLLDEMEAEGVPRAEVDKVAAGLKDYLDAESGNYKRPTTEAGHNALQLQRSFMTVTALAGLPLATISSFVELALTQKGLTVDQIFGKNNSLKSVGEEFAETMWQGTKEIAAAAQRKERPQVDRTSGRQRLRDLGYYDWDVGAATTTGVTEIKASQQFIFERFFKWTGLQGWTNYTRAARGAIAQDYFSDKVSLINDQRLSGESKTREIQEAEEQLRNYGIDVDQYSDITQKLDANLPISKEEEAFMADTTREATYNFINDAVALPGSANRPLIYQDPRFALFTQFQGFIATFTANHIPKLWGEYAKRGTPAMKYNAFAVMTTMIAMGFASQYLKDLIKFGGHSPYLDKPEYIQRGIRSSGLLGSYERVLDLAFPIYGDTRSKNPGDWAFKQVTGESPALSNLSRFGKAGGKFLEGDVGEGVRNTLKASPFFGPFSGLNEAIGQAASGWNFKGGGNNG